MPKVGKKPRTRLVESTRAGFALRAWMEERGIGLEEMARTIAHASGRTIAPGRQKNAAVVLYLQLHKPRIPLLACRLAVQKVCEIPLEWWLEHGGERLVNVMSARSARGDTMKVSESGARVEASPEGCVAPTCEQPEQTVGVELPEAS